MLRDEVNELEYILMNNPEAKVTTDEALAIITTLRNLQEDYKTSQAGNERLKELMPQVSDTCKHGSKFSCEHPDAPAKTNCYRWANEPCVTGLWELTDAK